MKNVHQFNFVVNVRKMLLYIIESSQIFNAHEFFKLFMSLMKRKHELEAGKTKKEKRKMKNIY